MKIAQHCCPASLLFLETFLLVSGSQPGIGPGGAVLSKRWLSRTGEGRCRDGNSLYEQDFHAIMQAYMIVLASFWLIVRRLV